jgi:hypothetical protein
LRGERGKGNGEGAEGRGRSGKGRRVGRVGERGSRRAKGRGDRASRGVLTWKWLLPISHMATAVLLHSSRGRKGCYSSNGPQMKGTRRT